MKAPTLLESKECQLEIAARAKTQQIVVRKQVCTEFKKPTAWLLLIIEFNDVNMMALQTRLLNLPSDNRLIDHQSIFWSRVISLHKVGIQYL